jgi:hypothetical protein
MNLDIRLKDAAMKRQDFFLIQIFCNLLEIFLANEVYFSNVQHHFDGVFHPLIYQLKLDIEESYVHFFQNHLMLFDERMYNYQLMDYCVLIHEDSFQMLVFLLLIRLQLFYNSI